jgi:epoxyqueuosine reductase
MDYLASPRSRLCRAHPRKILSECRSVLALGVRYPAPRHAKTSTESRAELRGKIASYAWGIDYHAFLPERLRSLVQFIEAQVGEPVPNRCYSDTGPILERELAQQAGLGWIGKNTCLISPRQGSYFLLAEILLGVELPPDPPFAADRCGSCTRCIDTCPTSCILPDRTLDARRCISYLTIELKGAISPDLRPLMGEWVFGCDVCQQVCPWNRFAAAPADLAFSHELAAPEPNLLEYLALTSSEFNRKYRYSPLSRAKRRGYLRNIAVALGNTHNSQAIPALTQALSNDPEPLVRSHAAWALGQIGTIRARQALQKSASHEVDAEVLQEIERSRAQLL